MLVNRRCFCDLKMFRWTKSDLISTVNSTRFLRVYCSRCESDDLLLNCAVILRGLARIIVLPEGVLSVKRAEMTRALFHPAHARAFPDVA